MKRRLSWLVGVLAYTAPPLWAYFEQASVYANLRAQHGYVCGLPMLAIFGIACILSAGLAAMSLWLAAPSFRSLPRPRPKGRIAELAVLGLPLGLPIALVGLLLVY